MLAQLMGLKSLSPRALHQAMQQGPVIVIDLNSARSWATHHVPGALHRDPAALAGGDLPAGKEDMVVFYCSNFLCRKAPTAARRARNMGYRNVQVMSAGISGWLDAGLPTEAGPAA